MDVLDTSTKLITLKKKNYNKYKTFIEESVGAINLFSNMTNFKKLTNNIIYPLISSTERIVNMVLAVKFIFYFNYFYN